MGRKKPRIDRKNKQKTQAQKKARFSRGLPDSSKSPRASVEPNKSIAQMQMDFRLFEYGDREGAWSWKQKRNWCLSKDKGGAGCTVRRIMEKMSQLTWAEIWKQSAQGHKKHHHQNLGSLCKEAQDRWKDINRTEDELFRFRASGEKRIWGVRQGATFFVVWWDAEHKIYPTEKK